ncbi:hypothetical protein HYC85_026918, partial [Camellia sinensis]
GKSHKNGITKKTGLLAFYNPLSAYLHLWVVITSPGSTFFHNNMPFSYLYLLLRHFSASYPFYWACDAQTQEGMMQVYINTDYFPQLSYVFINNKKTKQRRVKPNSLYLV